MASAFRKSSLPESDSGRPWRSGRCALPNGRYGCETAPVVRGTVVLVEVGKLPRESRKPKKLWLWFSADGEPDLDLLWRAYVRRFDLEHAIRFLKQTLGWTAPRVRHPEQADLWSWLVLAAYAQLRLARPCVADRCLPWERPQRQRGLTPCRTLRGFAALLAVVGTPAGAPKTLRTLTGSAQRAALRAGEALPGHQEGCLSSSGSPLWRVL
jgi:hypothetical protein